MDGFSLQVPSVFVAHPEHRSAKRETPNTSCMGKSGFFMGGGMFQGILSGGLTRKPHDTSEAITFAGSEEAPKPPPVGLLV